MRLSAGVLLLLSSLAGIARADPTVPVYDSAKTCRTLAEYAFAATLGEADVSREIDACTAKERDQKGSVDALWPLASDADRAECLGLAQERYGYLARCLAASRSVRAAR